FYRILSYLVSDAATATYFKGFKIKIKFFVAGTTAWCQQNMYYFSFSIRIHGEIMNLAFFIAFGKIVFLIAGNAGHIKSLRIADSFFTISINHVVRSAFIIFIKHGYMDDIFTNKNFIRYFNYFHLTRFRKDNDIIQITTIRNKLILFQTRPDKAFGAVYIDL